MTRRRQPYTLHLLIRELTRLEQTCGPNAKVCILDYRDFKINRLLQVEIEKPQTIVLK